MNSNLSIFSFNTCAFGVICPHFKDKQTGSNLPKVIECISRRAGIQTQKIWFRNSTHLTASLCYLLGVQFLTLFHNFRGNHFNLNSKVPLYFVNVYCVEGNMDEITWYSCFKFIFSNCFCHKTNLILIIVCDKRVKLNATTADYFSLL